MSALVIDSDPTITLVGGADRVVDRARLLDNGYCHGLITQDYAQKFFPPHEVHEVVQTDLDEAPIPDDEYRIAHGAEIWFTGDRDPMPSGEVALLPGAWLAARRHDQGAVYFPAHRIDSVHTHTSDEQESAGWFR